MDDRPDIYSRGAGCLYTGESMGFDKLYHYQGIYGGHGKK